MVRRILRLTILGLILLPICSHAQIIAIRAGRVLDPEIGKTAANQIISVEKGKITAIGVGLNIPADATVIDLSRFTVLPGLFGASGFATIHANRD